MTSKFWRKKKEIISELDLCTQLLLAELCPLNSNMTCLCKTNLYKTCLYKNGSLGNRHPEMENSVKVEREDGYLQPRREVLKETNPLKPWSRTSSFTMRNFCCLRNGGGAQRSLVTCPRSHKGKGGSQTQTVTLASIHFTSALSMSTDTMSPSEMNSQRCYQTRSHLFSLKAHVKENSWPPTILCSFTFIHF